MRKVIGALCLFAVVCLASTAQGQTLTFPATLNSYSPSDIRNDERPQVVSDGNGTWVAVWDSTWWQPDQYGSDIDLFFARSTDNGATWSTAQILNTNAASDSGDDFWPIISTDNAGNWVCIWQSYDSLGNTIGTDADILVSRSSNNGQTWTAPAALNTNAATDGGATDEFPKLATDNLGNWVAIWDSNVNSGGSGTDYDVRVARSTNNGQTWTAPAILNSNGTTDTGVDTLVELATDRIGNWVAIWQGSGFSGTDADILVSRSTNNGQTWSAVALLNSTGSGDTATDERPGLAADGNGNWVAVWTSNLNSGGSGTDYDVRVSRSSNAGASWSVPALLNTNGTTDTGVDEYARIFTDGTGNWIAVWDGPANFGGSDGDFDAWYSRSTNNGQTWSTLALLNTNGNTDSLYDLVPQLGTDRQGNWIGVWESNDLLTGGKGSDWDILFTRFTLPLQTLTVSSITPATAGPTNASSVAFTVNFSQPVINFNNASDLVITHSGTANSGVSITGGPQSYTVNVTGISGTGSFTLAAATNSDIQSSAGGAPLASSPTSAAVNIDNTAPTATLSSAAGDPVGGPISVSVSLSESSTNFTSADISTTNASVLNFSGSGTTYSFTLSPITSALFSASVPAGSFTDAAGNGNTASNSVSRTAVIVSPSITLASAAGDPVNGGIVVTASLSASSTDFTAADVTPSNASVSGFSGSGSSYSFTLTPLAGGSFSASVGAGTFTDSGGNPNLASNTVTRTADLTAPTATLSSAAGDPVNGAISVSVSISESVSNFASADISATNATVSNFTGSGTSYSFTLTPTASGLFSASIPAASFSDAAGNSNPLSNTLSRTADLVAPTITLSSAAGDPVSGSITVTAALSESSTNFAAADVTTVNAQITNFSGSGASYSFLLTPVVSGVFSASVNAGTFTDAAGNNNTASNSVSRTASLPNGAGISLTSQAFLNTDATSDSATDERPQIETDGNGNWVVVWDRYSGTSGTDFDIWYARSTNNGQTWTAPAALNTNAFTDSRDDLRPAIATDRQGNWITIWYSNDSLGGTKGTDYDIVYSRSTNAGQTWSAPAVLNTNGTTDFGDDEIPRIAADNSGNWVCVWDSNSIINGNGGDYDVFVSRSSNGTTWTAPALLNSNATTDGANDNRTEIVTDRAGVWVVLWASNAAFGAPVTSDNDIFVSRSTDNGATWATMARVDSNDFSDTGDDARPALATDGLGNWIASWHSNDNLNGQSGTDTDIFVSRSSNGGVSWTTGALLNTNGNSDSGLDEFVRLMSDGAGNWFAIWDSSESLGGLNGTDYDVFISRSTNNGLTWTPPSIVNSNANIDNGFDLVAQFATDYNGNWVATWEGNPTNNGAGNDWDIYVSRFFLAPGLTATSVVPTTTGPTNASSVSFSVSFSDNVVNFNNASDLVISHTGTANSGVSITGGPQNYVVNVTGITGNGSFTLAASTGSDIQTSGGSPLISSATSAAVTIDTTAPTITLSSNAPEPTNGPVSVSVTLSESSANFGSDDVTLVNATLSNFTGSGSSYSFSISPIATGTYSASVVASRFTDGAGNNNTASNTLSRTSDTAAPTITLASVAAATVNGAITVTATLSKASTNFAAGDVSTVNGSVSGFSGSGTSYSFALTPAADGLFSATVNAGTFTDALSNANTASNTLSRTADLTAPTITLASVAGDPVSGAITVTATLSEASTTFTSADVSAVNASVSGFTGSNTSYSFTLTPVAGGLFSATVNAARFTDAVGNDNTASNTLSRTADLTAPTATLSSAAGDPVGGAITVSVTLSESSVNFAEADISTVNAFVSGFSGSGSSYSFTLTPSGDGLFSASVPAARFTDAAGNNNTASNTLSRTANLSAPSITLSSAAAATVREAITVTASLSSSSTNFASEDITAVNATISGFSGSGGSYSFTLTPVAEGLFSASVAADTFTNSVGTANTASNTLSRTADFTAPTVTLSSNAASFVTGAISVSVTLSESSTNFTSGDVSAVNATVSGFSGSGASYAFTLTPTADGEFSAAVNANTFTDVAGNTNSASNTLSRTADITVPTISLASAAPGTVNGAITVTATLSESSVNFTSADISIVNASVSDFTGSGPNYSFTLTPAANGTFSATVNAGTFTDASGNNNTASNTLTRTANLNVPTATLTSAAAATVRLPITVNVALSEASTDFTSGDITAVNATVSGFAGTGTSYSFTLTPLASGTFTAQVIAGAFTNAANTGNSASNVLSRVADVTAPTITLASVAADPVGGAITVTATLSESSTTFTSADVTRANCAISNFSGSGTGYSFTLTPSATGVFSATVNAGVFTDTIGNSNTASNTLSRTADLTRPTITLSSATASPVNGAFTIDVTTSEPTTNFVATDITTVNGTVSNFIGSGSAYSFTLTPLANGTTSASVSASRFTDAVGNNNTASNTLSRTADLTAPTVSMSSKAGSPVTGAISVSVTLSESSTNFVAADITPGNATVSAFSGSGRNYTFTLTPLADGAITAQVLAGAFTDAAGNDNVASALFSRTADITPPTATLNSAAPAIVTGSISVTVVLTESSTNFTSADVTRTNCSISNFTGSGANYSFTLTPSSAGVFTATVPAGRFSDSAGNQNTASNVLSRTRQ